MKLHVIGPGVNKHVEVEWPFYYEYYVNSGTKAIVMLTENSKTVLYGSDGTYTIQNIDGQHPTVSGYDYDNQLTKEQFEAKRDKIIADKWPFKL